MPQIETPDGKTPQQVHDEINELYMKQEELKDQINYKILERLRKEKQVRMNILLPAPKKQHSIPIDGDLKQGSRLFMMHCSGCHNLEVFTFQNRGVVETRKQTSNGPSLGVIYNRPAGSQLLYGFYTDQLLHSKVYWNSYNLFRWLEGPDKMIPGTLCMKNKKPLSSIQDRADLVKFLKAFDKAANDHRRKTTSIAVGQTQRNYQEQSFQRLKERVAQEAERRK